LKKLLAPIAIAAAILVASPAVAQTVAEGDITSDTTWSGTVLLSGAVFVRGGATLTIEPGTLILGETATNGTLIIDRGSRINAVGTPRNPIVFTADQERGDRFRGMWGGIIINGYAPLNVPGGEAEGEGDTGTYGGNKPNDDSGTMKYVRVEFAGTEFSPDNELNGIAFQGVGRGGTFEYLQVHLNKDDGVEFFGGTAEAKYLVLTGNADDSLDATDGWTGKVQFVFVQQYGDDADNGHEIDNNGDNNNLRPYTAPQIYNVTLIGDPSDFGDESDLGMLLREGTAGTFANYIVMGFKEWGIEITDSRTFRNAANGSLLVRNAYWDDNGSALAARVGGTQHWSDNAEDDPVPSTTTAEYMAAWPGNVTDQGNPLRKPYRKSKPDPRPKNVSWKNAIRDGGVTPPDDGFFDLTASFLGAFRKGAPKAALWFRPWAAFPPD
jgi:hypothetical protein